MTISDRVRIKDVRVLSDNWTTLKTTTFEYRRANGECEQLVVDVVDPHRTRRQLVLAQRQPRPTRA